MKVGDWYENSAGVIYSLKSCKRLPNKVRIFTIGPIGSDREDRSVNEFVLNKEIKLGFLHPFRKWG